MAAVSARRIHGPRLNVLYPASWPVRSHGHPSRLRGRCRAQFFHRPGLCPAATAPTPFRKTEASCMRKAPGSEENRKTPEGHAAAVRKSARTVWQPPSRCDPSVPGGGRSCCRGYFISLRRVFRGMISSTPNSVAFCSHPLEFCGFDQCCSQDKDRRRFLGGKLCRPRIQTSEP